MSEDWQKRPPETPEQVAETVGADPVNRGTVIVMAEGQVSAFGVDRPQIQLVRISRENVPAVIGVVHPQKEDVAEIARRLGEIAKVWPGECDAMAMVGWSFVWSLEPFRLWNRKGIRIAVDGELVRLARRPRTLQLTTGEIAHVAARISEDWCQRSVVLVRREGRPVHVCGENDQAPRIVPFYDGFNLSMEAGWIRGVAQAIAKGIGRPAVIAEEV